MNKDDLIGLALVFFFLLCEAINFLFWAGVCVVVIVLAYQLGFEMGVEGLTWGDIFKGVKDG